MKIRAAIEGDTPAIQEIFRANYGHEYTYPEYYEELYLKKVIYSDDTLMLVCEDPEAGVIGTAAVVLASGAYSDLAGEFGRLAVHPDHWGRGIGALLLEERVRRVEERLHVGFMEARVTHPYSLKNGIDHGFAPVGFLVQKLRFGDRRESTALLVRHFGDALNLRRNHPRVIPEAFHLTGAAMDLVGLVPDFIVDERAAPYPQGGEYAVQELTSQGYSTLLRIERGRLRHREIFGPLRLHYGFFRLSSGDSTYLIARRDGRVVGAIGFTHDKVESIVRVFELINLEDQAVRFLLEELERRSRWEYDVSYIEIDVSAYAPRMQRTLLELGYLPCAYVPALAFHRVERLDVLKMCRLLVPFDPGDLALVAPAEGLAQLVLMGFERLEVVPRLGEMVHRAGMFTGLTDEQFQRLAACCGHAAFAPGEYIFREGTDCAETYLILEGEVAVEVSGRSEPVGRVVDGECLGEVALLTETTHSAGARVTRAVTAAVFSRDDLVELVRQRPDIGVVLFRNLASGLGEKLRRTDRAGLV
jgi:GNAT superfamily N-acetyltransferase